MEGRKLTARQTTLFKRSASPNPPVPGANTAALHAVAAAADRQGIRSGRILVKDYDQQQQKIDADAEYIDSFPSGVRFRPTNEELIVHYLARKVNKQPLPPNKMVEADLYMHHPQVLSETYKPVVENGWYFFTSRDRKYPKGNRPNRRANEGFWKATGADKSIKSTSNGAVIIGFKKTLVYYEGKAPKGDRKTEWIMHEFRVNGPPRKRKDDNDMKLDDWVLCRLYKKGGKITAKNQDGLTEEKEQNSPLVSTSDTADKEVRLDGQSIPLHYPPEDANIRGGYYAQLSDFPPSFDIPPTPPQFWDIGYKAVMHGGGSVHHFLADSSVGSRYQSVNPWDFNPSGVHVQGGCGATTNYFTDPSWLAGPRNKYNSGLVDYSGGYTAQFVRMDQVLPAAHNQPMNNSENISNTYSGGTNVGTIMPGYNQLANTAAATNLTASHTNSAPPGANMGKIMPTHNQLANNATATNHTASHPSRGQQVSNALPAHNFSTI